MIERTRNERGVFQVAHGMCNTRTFRIWQKMRRRCTDPKAENWKWYGAKGVTVCERWDSFANFLADMGECPDGLTIDRIDTTKGYEPSNCKWSTMLEQSRNRTNNIRMVLDGRDLCLSEWAIETGIKIGTLWWRYKAGWSTERILRTPVKAQ